MGRKYVGTRRWAIDATMVASILMLQLYVILRHDIVLRMLYTRINV